MTKRKGKVVFKPYNPDQLSLLPPSLEELIPENYVVRVVRQVIDNLDIEPIYKKYKGGGTSSYHPKMMLKILVYGYLSNIYSSRKIEQYIVTFILCGWQGCNGPRSSMIDHKRKIVACR